MNIDCCKSYVGKQIIGLLPSGGGTPPAQQCLWFTSFDDFNCLGFTTPGWDFNGFGVDFSAYANSFGGYYVQDGTPQGSCFPFFTDLNSTVIFYFYGENQPADLIVTDPYNNTTRLSFINPNTCSIGCITTNSIRPVNSPYEWITIATMPMSGANLINYGGYIDFSLGATAVQLILGKVLQAYQPQATVSVQDDGSGFFTITFNNFIYNQSLLNNIFTFYYNTGNDQDIYDLIEC